MVTRCGFPNHLLGHGHEASFGVLLGHPGISFWDCLRTFGHLNIRGRVLIEFAECPYILWVQVLHQIVGPRVAYRDPTNLCAPCLFVLLMVPLETENVFILMQTNSLCVFSLMGCSFCVCGRNLYLPQGRWATASNRGDLSLLPPSLPPPLPLAGRRSPQVWDLNHCVREVASQDPDLRRWGMRQKRMPVVFAP